MIWAAYTVRNVDPIERPRRCTGFDWDDGNAGKNWGTHQVPDGECEQAFFNQPLVAMPDHEHSDDEDRILVLGKTDSGRKPFVVCTIRLPSFMLEEIKQLAHKRDVPYQSLIKLFLAERVKRELHDGAA